MTASIFSLGIISSIFNENMTLPGYLLNTNSRQSTNLILKIALIPLFLMAVIMWYIFSILFHQQLIIHVQMTGDKEKGGATSPGSAAHETEDQRDGAAVLEVDSSGVSRPRHCSGGGTACWYSAVNSCVIGLLLQLSIARGLNGRLQTASVSLALLSYMIDSTEVTGERQMVTLWIMNSTRQEFELNRSCYRFIRLAT